MSFNSFDEIRRYCLQRTPVKAAVAAAEDEAVLEAAVMAEEMGIVECILVGDEEKIRKLSPGIKLRIINEPDEKEAARKAVMMVRQNEAQILMKGLINSSDFLRAVLDPENGLRTGSLLSHLAIYEVKGRLLFLTDGGMNIEPGFAEKKQILENALGIIHNMGWECPNVAVLTANEKVSAKMKATVDAAALCEMGKSGEIAGCVIEGPIALDVAVSKSAAEHKGITSGIAGKTDLFLMPNIEAGNMVGKTLSYFAGAKMAGLILGAAAPVVMTSRADSAEEKCSSLACAAAACKIN